MHKAVWDRLDFNPRNANALKAESCIYHRNVNQIHEARRKVRNGSYFSNKRQTIYPLYLVNFRRIIMQNERTHKRLSDNGFLTGTQLQSPLFIYGFCR